MSREIRGLRWARLASDPWGRAKPPRARGAKALGLSYERAFAKAAPWALRGQWFEFEDAAGGGFCQVDFLARVEDVPVVFELKLTDAEGARRQLELLYRPVVERALGENVLCVAVLKHLSALRGLRGEYELHDSPAAALLGAMAAPGKLALLHWLGRGPLPLHSLVPQAPLCVSAPRRAA